MDLRKEDSSLFVSGRLIRLSHFFQRPRVLLDRRAEKLEVCFVLTGLFELEVKGLARSRLRCCEVQNAVV